MEQVERTEPAGPSEHVWQDLIASCRAQQGLPVWQDLTAPCRAQQGLTGILVTHLSRFPIVIKSRKWDNVSNSFDDAT